MKVIHIVLEISLAFYSFLEIDTVWSLCLSCCPDILMTDGTQKPSSTSTSQAALQNLQPASAPSNSMKKMGYLSHFHWTHAVIAVGLLAASGAGTAVLFKVLHSKELSIYHANPYHIVLFLLSIPHFFSVDLFFISETSQTFICGGSVYY